MKRVREMERICWTRNRSQSWRGLTDSREDVTGEKIKASEETDSPGGCLRQESTGWNSIICREIHLPPRVCF